MEPLLFLAHRIPYPPNKGDKIRSFNLLRQLVRHYRVYLGFFVDSAEDRQHVKRLSEMCAQVFAVPLNPALSRIKSLTGLLTGEPLTLRYYRSRAMHEWVVQAVNAAEIRQAVAFSSPMAQYCVGLGLGLDTIVDLVDVDSAKWSGYAAKRRWPLSMLYRREGVRLLEFERAAVLSARAAVLVTPAEVALFEQFVPDASGRVHAIGNGVDAEYFAPCTDRRSPFGSDETPLVFTGAMDYWPNVDAVTWFAREILPQIATHRPDVRFHIVGMNPVAAVRALTGDARVRVTGAVPDVRPYLQHAAAVVAPLRVARGVQNKVLEAMAMGRPVIVSEEVAAGLEAMGGVEFEVASSAESFARRTLAALELEPARAMGARARQRILSSYGWDASFARFAQLLAGSRKRSSAVADSLIVAG